MISTLYMHSEVNDEPYSEMVYTAPASNSSSSATAEDILLLFNSDRDIDDNQHIKPLCQQWSFWALIAVGVVVSTTGVILALLSSF